MLLAVRQGGVDRRRNRATVSSSSSSFIVNAAEDEVLLERLRHCRCTSNTNNNVEVS